jgi:hypothetical protein
MQIVWAYLAILEQDTGWEACDRQLGRSLDLVCDLDEVAGWYASLSARLHRRFPEALRRLPFGWRYCSEGQELCRLVTVVVTLRDGTSQWALARRPWSYHCGLRAILLWLPELAAVGGRSGHSPSRL